MAGGGAPCVVIRPKERASPAEEKAFYGLVAQVSSTASTRGLDVTNNVGSARNYLVIMAGGSRQTWSHADELDLQDNADATRVVLTLVATSGRKPFRLGYLTARGLVCRLQARRLLSGFDLDETLIIARRLRDRRGLPPGHEFQ